MTFNLYARDRLGEFILVFLATWAMSCVGFNAFFLDGIAPWRMWAALPLVFGLLVLLYAAAYKRSRWLPGTISYIAVVAVLGAIALGMSTGEVPYQDAEGNYLYFVLVMAFSAAGCFLLTRTSSGCAIWFVVAAFLCSVVQAFYQSGELVLSVIAIVSSLSLVVARVFRAGRSAADVASAGGLSSTGAFVFSCLPVLLAGACSLLLWFGVIAPLNPGVLEIKLVTDYRALPIVELKGTADKDPYLNTELKSKELAEGLRYTTDDLKVGKSKDKVPANSVPERQRAQVEGQQGAGTSGGAHDIIDIKSPIEQFTTMSYSEIFAYIWYLLLALALIALAIAAFFLVRRKLRKRRLVKMLSGSPPEQVSSIYLFLLNKLQHLGYAVPTGATLSGFAHSREHSMAEMTLLTGASFADLTDTYVKCAYGGYVPTEDDVVPFVAYYQGFWKAARARLGNFKYFFKSFLLG